MNRPGKKGPTYRPKLEGTTTDDFPFEREFDLRLLIDHLSEQNLLDEKTKSNIVENFCGLKDQKNWTSENINRTVQSLLPYLTIKNGPFAIISPFTLECFYSSPMFKEQFEDEEGRFQGRFFMENTSFSEYIIKSACVSILNRVYGMEIKSTDAKATFANRDLPDRYVKYFFFEKDSKFCEVICHDKLEIDTKTRKEILGSLNNTDKLLNILGKTKYIFRGLVIVQAFDVTTTVILNGTKNRLIKTSTICSSKNIKYMAGSLRTILHRQDVKFGISALHNGKLYHINEKDELKYHCIIRDLNCYLWNSLDHSIFRNAAENSQIVIHHDLNSEKKLGPIEEKAKEEGALQFVAVPIYSMDELIGFIDLSASKACTLSIF